MPIAASAASAVVAHIASEAVSTASTVAAHIASAAATSGAAAPASSFASNDAWLNGFATLVGALAGGFVASLVAYKLQVRATEKREREQGLNEGHQLMFCIIQQLNTVLLAWTDRFAAHVNDRGRFMNVDATTPFDLDRNVLELGKLTILLDCKAGRSVLYDLNVAQEAYREALWMLNERSRMHRNELQPALEKSTLNGSEVSNVLIMEEVGERLVLTMIGLTDGCYMTMHKAFLKLAAVKDKARQYIVERFGTDDFSQVDFPETKGIEVEPALHYPKRPFRPPAKATWLSLGTAYNWCRFWPG